MHMQVSDSEQLKAQTVITRGERQLEHYPGTNDQNIVKIQILSFLKYLRRDVFIL